MPGGSSSLGVPSRNRPQSREVVVPVHEATTTATSSSSTWCKGILPPLVCSLLVIVGTAIGIWAAVEEI